jgi:hypothetical protein
VDSPLGQKQSWNDKEAKRRQLYFNIIDHCLGEMASRFSERNKQVGSVILGNRDLDRFVITLYISSDT